MFIMWGSASRPSAALTWSRREALMVAKRSLRGPQVNHHASRYGERAGVIERVGHGRSDVKFGIQRHPEAVKQFPEV